MFEAPRTPLLCASGWSVCTCRLPVRVVFPLFRSLLKPVFTLFFSILQENYINMKPHAAGTDDGARMAALAAAADNLSAGDQLISAVRRTQKWSLMPTALAVACIAPAAIMRGSRTGLGVDGDGGYYRFPGWLARRSRLFRALFFVAFLHPFRHARVPTELVDSFALVYRRVCVVGRFCCLAL